jgi:ribosomal protein S18 acetylase RimI-like enzyme
MDPVSDGGRRSAEIALRAAVAADSEFGFELHKAAMGDYVAAAWGWDEQVQRDFHARGFDPARWRIITADGADIGMISVEYRPAEIYLSRIEILPGYQGRGIGTGLITELAGEAARRGQDLALDVLAVNPRARALYQRLGMHEVARRRDADGVTRISMRTSRPLA